MMRYFIYTLKTKIIIWPSLVGVLIPTQPPTCGAQAGQRLWPNGGSQKMKDKHMARNYGSPSMKVLWTGKLPKGVSYPSLLC